MTAKTKRRCLNCGEKVTGAYCPRCGQPTSTARLTTMAFLKNALSNLLRVNRGFLFTAKRLVMSPWRVINDYVKGRRIAYTPPVQMLVILCLIAMVEKGFLESDASSNIQEIDFIESETQFATAINSAIRFYLTSLTLQYLTVFLPCTLALRIVYKKHGAARYNAAEYLAATIYMADTIIIINIVTSLLDTIARDDISTLINMLFVLYMVVVSLLKAFPCGSRLSNSFHIIGFLALTATFYLLIFTAFGFWLASIQ